MKSAFTLTFGLALLLALLFWLFPDAGPAEAPQATVPPPWQIERLPEGSTRVFGLIPGKSTLSDAESVLGTDRQLAIVANRDDSGALEAYYESVNPGGVSGRLILTLEADRNTLNAMIERGRKHQYMDSGARQTLLADGDAHTAKMLPIKALSFIPSTNLDETMVLGRFGPPAERVRTTPHTEHFLYPAQGLDLILDSEGKELLQYVPPPRFDAVRMPLAQVADKP